MLTQAKGKDSPNAACINGPKNGVLSHSATSRSAWMSPCLLVLFDCSFHLKLYVSTVESIQLPIVDIQLFFAFLVPQNNLTNIFYRPAWPKAFPPPVARTTPNRILLSRKGVTTIYMYCLRFYKKISCYHLPLPLKDLDKERTKGPSKTILKSLIFGILRKGKSQDPGNKFQTLLFPQVQKHVCHIVRGQAKCSTKRQRWRGRS